MILRCKAALGEDWFQLKLLSLSVEMDPETEPTGIDILDFPQILLQNIGRELFNSEIATISSVEFEGHKLSGVYSIEAILLKDLTKKEFEIAKKNLNKIYMKTHKNPPNLKKGGRSDFYAISAVSDVQEFEDFFRIEIITPQSHKDLAYKTDDEKIQEMYANYLNFLNNLNKKGLNIESNIILSKKLTPFIKNLIQKLEPQDFLEKDPLASLNKKLISRKKRNM